VTTEAELVRAIAADLDDPKRWTAYLDWLLEGADPRGELMRAQRARAPLDDAEDFDKAERDALDEQIAALLDAHGATWLAEVDALRLDGLTFEIVNGVVGRVTGSAVDLAQHAAAILEAAPLLTEASVVLDPDAPDVSPLARSPLLARLRSVQFGPPHGGEPVKGWSAIEAPNLRSMKLSTIRFGAGDIEVLFAGPRFPRLEALTLEHCTLDEGALAPLARTRCPLRRIEMPFQGPAIAEPLGRLRGLVDVRLACCDLGRDGVAALAPALADVTHLDLRCNRLDAGALGALLRPDSKITVLQLGANTLEDDGIERIASWPGAGRLTHLDVCTNSASDEGALAIARSTELSTRLVKLELADDTGLKASTRKALLDAPHLVNAAIYVGTPGVLDRPALTRKGPTPTSKASAKAKAKAKRAAAPRARPTTTRKKR
jgi:uncharacterized protein (TIGR02996 family)